MNDFYVKAWYPGQDSALDNPMLTAWYGTAEAARQDYDWRKTVKDMPPSFHTPFKELPSLYSCLELGSEDGGPLLVWYAEQMKERV